MCKGHAEVFKLFEIKASSCFSLANKLKTLFKWEEDMVHEKQWQNLSDLRSITTNRCTFPGFARRNSTTSCFSGK
jgi:uncharacterized protein involved in tolerance to divalent cations